jgi:parallel beta-helix repeat protein
MVRNGERPPVLDRIVNDERLEHGEKVLSKAVAVIVTFALLTSILSLLIGINMLGDQGVPVKISYIRHYTVIIYGDSELASSNATVGGSGTAIDPYIIEDWEINGSEYVGYTHLIAIYDTNAFFKIRNCYLHNNLYDGSGIYLSNVKNGTIENNTCRSPSDCGIMLQSSSNNNTITNNNCDSNAIGIFLYLSCNNNTVTNNTCLNNGGNGILLWTSNNNTLNNNTCSAAGSAIGLNAAADYNIITNNTCSGGVYGISLGPGSNNTLYNNTCSDNYYGIWLRYSSDNTLNRNTCHSNQIGIIIFDIPCHRNTITNNNCSSNNESGILFGGSWNTATNNTCNSNNGSGISLGEAYQSILSNNTCSDNLRWGVHIDSSSNDNTIWNNTFIGNNGSGSVYNPSNNQACDNGTNNHWNSSGSPHGYGNYWSDWTAPDDYFPWGIVDDPYDISGSIGAKDFFPLVTYPYSPIPEFSDLIVPMLGMIGLFLLIRGCRSKR